MAYSKVSTIRCDKVLGLVYWGGTGLLAQGYDTLAHKGSLTVFLGFLAKVNSNARHEEKEKGESERD